MKISSARGSQKKGSILLLSFGYIGRGVVLFVQLPERLARGCMQACRRTHATMYVNSGQTNPFIKDMKERLTERRKEEVTGGLSHPMFL